MARATWGGKGFIWLLLPQHSSSLKEVMTGTQAGQQTGGQELMQGLWRGVTDWFASYGLLGILF